MLKARDVLYDLPNLVLPNLEVGFVFLRRPIYLVCLAIASNQRVNLWAKLIANLVRNGQMLGQSIKILGAFGW